MTTDSTSWRALLSLYLDRRLLRIFIFGMSSGFPWVMIGSAMTAWLAEEGLSRSNIGFFGFVFVAYSINFLWSPLMDRLKVPLIHRLGQRKSWIMLMQVMVAVCCCYIAIGSPGEDLAWTKFIALLLALSSATLDISIDAYRIDSLPEDDPRLMSAGAAMATSGWWTGFAGLGAIPLIMVDFESLGWSEVYFGMAVAMFALVIATLLAPEPKSNRVQQQSASKDHYLKHLAGEDVSNQWGLLLAIPIFLAGFAWLIIGFPGIDVTQQEYAVLALLLLGVLGYVVWGLVVIEKAAGPVTSSECAVLFKSGFDHKVSLALTWLLVSFVEPMAEFFRRNGLKLALSVLLFIFLFKIGEAFLGRMSIVFYKEVGFSNSDIAVYSKLVSWWVTIAFSLIGSAVTMRYGILRGLFIGGLAMSASNLMFAVIAVVGASKALLVSAVVIDGFTTAWSTVAFVAFLSMMCNRAFTASQYALMASLGTLGRTFLASYSGWLVDALDGNWALFFAITALMVLPSLLFLYRIRHRLRTLSSEF